jgi:hypothetical protein
VSVVVPVDGAGLVVGVEVELGLPGLVLFGDIVPVEFGLLVLEVPMLELPVCPGLVEVPLVALPGAPISPVELLGLVLELGLVPEVDVSVLLGADMVVSVVVPVDGAGLVDGVVVLVVS